MTSSTAVTLDTGTRLAVDCTRLAYERTMMAWVRTGTSMISFGFTIYKFFQDQNDRAQPAVPAPTDWAARVRAHHDWHRARCALPVHD